LWCLAVDRNEPAVIAVLEAHLARPSGVDCATTHTPLNDVSR
jgi:hypothetical protein